MTAYFLRQSPLEPVPTSTSIDQRPEQPQYYLEEIEEEIYVSETMQEITDGKVVLYFQM